MIKEYTLGYIKNRITDALLEYGFCDKEYLVADDGQEMFDARIPNVLTASLVRMYESLPISTCVCFADLYENESEFEGCLKISLPQDFGKLIKLNVQGVDVTDKVKSGEAFLYLPECLCQNAEKAVMTYKKTVPEIDESKGDDYTLSLSPLALEALINLAASELCREGDSDAYTRLLYKYNDLVEGFFSANERKVSRNGFYKAFGRRL